MLWTFRRSGIGAKAGVLTCRTGRCSSACSISTSRHSTGRGCSRTLTSRARSRMERGAGRGGRWDGWAGWGGAARGWGDLGGRGKGMMHMLDLYPQQVVRTGIQEVWRRSPVSLETCGTPLSWKQWGYTDKQLQYIFDQALRWHASSINIKSTAIPAEWKSAFRDFEKKIGYRYVLRRLEY